MCAAPKGYSLHLGLNYVDPSQYEGWNGKLNACEDDAEDMASLAAGAGYTTHKLIRSQATRDAVGQGIRAAAHALSSGDIFLLTCSSHGGSIPNEQEGDDESDGNDETWCLFDGQLIDDELDLLWRDFAPGVRILLVSDSCHSATIAKVMPPALQLLSSGPRSRLMPGPVQRRVYLAQRDRYLSLQTSVKAQLRAARPLACTVRTLAACKDEELSYDGDENGQFTGALLAAWDFGRFDGDYAAFLRAIAANIHTPQTPQQSVIGQGDPVYAAQKPFTIGNATYRAILPGARDSSFADNDRRATEAIEAYLREKKPRELDIWRTHKPKSDWGMDLGTWRGVARNIIGRFNETDPHGSQIDPDAQEVQNAIINLHDAPLGEFHQFLVDRATSSGMGARLSASQAAPQVTE